MTETERKMMLGMVRLLNEASEAYYSGNPIMTDDMFDARLKDLQQFEEETGMVYSNSPSINVGARVLNELQEVVHNSPMLSLDKCHSVEELIDFSDGKELIASVKCDGMSCRLTFENGVLVRAESRGNGIIGNDITEHIKRFLNVPMRIAKTGTYVVDGECVITDEDFEGINQNGEFKNSRNLISGTLNSLDTSVVSQRKAKFICWNVVEGYSNNSFSDNLNEAKELGFTVVPFWSVVNLDSNKLQATIDYVFEYASDESIPNDGIVFKFNDVKHGKSLGRTEHHFKDAIAYKKQDDVHKTKLIDIEWSCGKSGQLTPVAIFEPVEIGGSVVEKASVHNISILTKLDLHIGDTVEVAKANAVIPQIKRNVSADERMALGKEPNYIPIPSECPVCGGDTDIRQDNDSKVLVCTNDNCKGKMLGKLTHFVSKNAVNVEGLNESTIEKFIELGWLTCFEDIYRLKYHADEMMKLDGFGKKSVTKLLSSIEKSRNTTLDRFIYSLSINLIGKSASRDIAKACANGDLNQFRMIMDLEAENAFIGLNGFGKEMSKSLNSWWIDNKGMFSELSKYFTFAVQEAKSGSGSLVGKVFCITGSLNHFANRDEAKEAIENAGGKVVNSVTSKTDYLVCNGESSSSKYKKAKEIGVVIVSEDELVGMLK